MPTPRVNSHPSQMAGGNINKKRPDFDNRAFSQNDYDFIKYRPFPHFRADVNV
jgi:hypothetical protein